MGLKLAPCSRRFTVVIGWGSGREGSFWLPTLLFLHLGSVLSLGLFFPFFPFFLFPFSFFLVWFGRRIPKIPTFL